MNIMSIHLWLRFKRANMGFHLLFSMFIFLSLVMDLAYHLIGLHRRVFHLSLMVFEFDTNLLSGLLHTCSCVFYFINHLPTDII